MAIGVMTEIEQDDAALVRLAREARATGGGAAFRSLYERHADEVHGFLVRLLRDPALAEDVLQESFFRAWKAIDAFDPARPFRAWLYQIVRNAAVDALRARKKEARLQDEKARRTVADDDRGPASAASRKEELARTGDALEALPEEARALLVQRHFLGTPLEELAASLAVTERTVRTRLQEAAALLSAQVLAVRAARGGVS